MRQQDECFKEKQGKENDRYREEGKERETERDRERERERDFIHSVHELIKFLTIIILNLKETKRIMKYNFFFFAIR